jgi:hypothetical protein
MGYLSGLSVALHKDVLKETDAPSIYAWVDNQCRANPLEMVGNLTQLLFLELVRQKGL